MRDGCPQILALGKYLRASCFWEDLVCQGYGGFAGQGAVGDGQVDILTAVGLDDGEGFAPVGVGVVGAVADGVVGAGIAKPEEFSAGDGDF